MYEWGEYHYPQFTDDDIEAYLVDPDQSQRAVTAFQLTTLLFINILNIQVACLEMKEIRQDK